MKIEKGVMVVKDGKAWGVTYRDGHATAYGWVDPEDAPIHNPEFCHSPSDVTYSGSPDLPELRSGTLIHVERRIQVIFMTPNTTLSDIFPAPKRV